MCTLPFVLPLLLDVRYDRNFHLIEKHYFYGDQPTGYQVTQHFEPYAMDGLLTLYSRDLDDGKSSSKKAKSSNDNEHKVDVRIKQIQIEQDTGKSTYIDDTANIDLNRSNHCLIELVTEPDIPNPESAGVFVKSCNNYCLTWVFAPEN